MIRELRKKSADLRKVVKGNSNLDTAAIEYTCNVIKAEVMSYSKKTDSQLIDSSAPALEKFSLQVCSRYIRVSGLIVFKCPLLCRPVCLLLKLH